MTLRAQSPKTEAVVSQGKEFGTLTVKELARTGGLVRWWRCNCWECGDEGLYAQETLQSGKALCPCQRRRENAKRLAATNRIVRPTAALVGDIVHTRLVVSPAVRFNPQPKDPEYRNRKLLDLAHRDDSECGNCERPGPCEPAHSNMAVHGKGERHKAHDVFAADLCHDCHTWLDQGIGPDPTGQWSDDRADKQAMWRRAFDRTLLRRWRLGIFQVNPK